MKAKKIVYIAGHTVQNWVSLVSLSTYRARRVAKQLWRQGYAVICPHSNSALMSCKDIAEVHFLHGYLTILEKCDVVVFVPGWENQRGQKKKCN